MQNKLLLVFTYVNVPVACFFAIKSLCCVVKLLSRVAVKSWYQSEAEDSLFHVTS